MEGRRSIFRKDIEWVLEFGHYSPRLEKKISAGKQVGCVIGLAVVGDCTGMTIDIEVTACEAADGRGSIRISGIVEEEEMDTRGQKLRKTSSAKSSVDNVLTVLKRAANIDTGKYDLHLNFPGGIPIDGSSAGTAISVAILSAIRNMPVDNSLALTGELSIRGKVKPVGGVAAKVEAARLAGITRVLIPKENWQEMFSDWILRLYRLRVSVRYLK